MNPIGSMPPKLLAVLACPYCRGSLSECDSGASCVRCHTEFGGIRGILDLRTVDDEYLPNARDWDIARALDSEYDRLDFRGLLDLYYHLMGDVPISLRQRQIAHILTAPARAEQWMHALGPIAQAGTILDLGCGPGGFLASRPRGERSWIGLDIAMRWLVLARKRMDECGRDDVQLVCGCAESLPFPDKIFSAIVAGDVVEHVHCRATMLSEGYRVLVNGGQLIAATPNRFSFAPEPHVNVWGVGFLPRSLMKPYVKLVRGVDFRAVTTHGWLGWKRLASKSPFEACEIVAPLVPIENGSPMKRLLVRVYNLAVGSWPGQFAAKAIGPLFHLTFEKVQRSSPATPLHSKPSTTRSSVLPNSRSSRPLVVSVKASTTGG